MSMKTTFAVITDGYGGANLTSNPFSISSFPLLSIQFWISSGTPSGSLTVEVSNYEDKFTDGYLSYTNADVSLNTYITTWTTLASVKNFPVANAYTATTVTSGSPATIALNFQDLGFKWMRLVWTNTSGTGTLQARCSGKRNKNSNL